MRARDLVYETASALEANRARSLLTILGIVIGIAAVIAMTAFIGGVKQAMVSDLGLGQARLVRAAYAQDKHPMTAKDVQAFATELAGDYESVIPVSYANAKVSSGTKEVESAQIRGVKPVYQEMMNINMAYGRFITEQECSSAELVIVLDQATVKNMFGNAEANVVGKTLRIGQQEYTIVGIEESSSGDSNSRHVEIYMPFETCCKRVAGSENVDSIFGLAREDSDMDTVAEHTKTWMARHFKVPDDKQEDFIWVQTMEAIIRQLDSMMLSFQILMTAVASISLVVGGIGIMNMMLTNVTERIREIGLRKALGARRRDITRQFLLESICLTLAGGAIGIALGYFGSFGLASIAGGMLDLVSANGESSISPVIDWQTMLMVAGICIAIGVVFGYYPARRAARLDPVESLRYQ